MAEHNDLGKWGEDEAGRYLESRGYVILERDWKCGKRDLDIIALNEEQDTLVFVEVKTRRNDDLQKPEEAVDERKIRNLAVAANSYVKLNKVQQDIRFDIVTVLGKRNQMESIEHIEDAFNPLLV